MLRRTDIYDKEMLLYQNELENQEDIYDALVTRQAK
jgi:hypothetical protein